MGSSLGFGTELICYKNKHKLPHACLHTVLQKTNVLSNECPEGYLVPLPDRSLSNTHTLTEIQVTRSFWFALSTLSVCYRSGISTSHSETLKPGLIFTHLNTTPDTFFSLSLVFLFQSHSLPLSENPNPPLSGSEWTASAEREAVFSMICNRITAVMLSGSLWQQQGGVFTVPWEIELDFKSCRSLFTSRCHNLVNQC